MLLTSFVAPRVSAGVLHRDADRLDVRRSYLLDTASAAVVAAHAAHIDYDFAENAPSSVVARSSLSTGLRPACSAGSSAAHAARAAVAPEWFAPSSRRAAVRMALRRLSEGCTRGQK